MTPINPLPPSTDPRVTRRAVRAEQTTLTTLWRFAKGFLVFLIVAFHLVVLAIRNPLDLWDKPIIAWMKENGYWERYEKPFKRADTFTWKYTNLVGCEQRWSMFTPPVARSAPFFGVRFEFTDGSSVFVRSEQEPERPESYLRMDGWQMRKLEDCLRDPPKNMKNYEERSFWEAYVRYRVKDWYQTHPDDPRKIKRLVFLQRRIYFPKPTEDPSHYEPPTEKVLITLDPEGKVVE